MHAIPIRSPGAIQSRSTFTDLTNVTEDYPFLYYHTFGVSVDTLHTVQEYPVTRGVNQTPNSSQSLFPLTFGQKFCLTNANSKP